MNSRAVSGAFFTNESVERRWISLTGNFPYESGLKTSQALNVAHSSNTRLSAANAIGLSPESSYSSRAPASDAPTRGAWHRASSKKKFVWRLAFAAGAAGACQIAHADESGRQGRANLHEEFGMILKKEEHDQSRE